MSKYPHQDLAISKLEKAGFRFVTWFDAHDPEDPEARCATMSKSFGRIARLQCEVDPAGYCNGEEADRYLAHAREGR